MSYERERGRFEEIMRGEGLTVAQAERVLRDAQTIQRCAERECSDESADRDRVPCPKELRDGYDGCLCRAHGAYNEEPCPARTCFPGEPCRHPEETRHGKIPRIAVRSARAERRIVAALNGSGVTAVFSGDPRGACVKLVVPSGRTDDWGQTGICVPIRY